MSKVVCKELEDTYFPTDHGTYDYALLLQQTGGQALAGITNGGNQSIMEFPPGVYNLAKTFLRYTVNPVAPGAGNYNFVFTDTCSEIQQLYLYTRTNTQLVQLPNANTYVNAVLRHETPLKEVLTNDIYQFDGNTWQGLQNLISGITTGGALSYYNPLIPSLGGTSTVNSPLTPAYYAQGGNNGADPSINRFFPLSIFKNTILELDRDIYFPETVYLKIVWENANRVYWTNNSLVTLNGAVAGTSYSYSNLSLYAAIEKNPVIVNDLMNKSQAGQLKYLVPYVQSDLINVPAGTNQSVMTRYNRGHGRRLMKIYWAPYANVQTLLASYDHNNQAQAKVVHFFTTINNVRTNQFDYYCANYDDYLIRRGYLAGSAILSSIDYYTNYTWIENFCNNQSKLDKPLSPPEQNYIDGLDLTVEQIYNIKATTANININHYVFAVGQKELSIAPGMITID